jgi:hypothetical protein
MYQAPSLKISAWKKAYQIITKGAGVVISSCFCSFVYDWIKDKPVSSSIKYVFTATLTLKLWVLVAVIIAVSVIIILIPDKFSFKKPVKIPAKFPGGDGEWRKYLEKSLNRDLPVKKGAPVGIYTVTVSFLIDGDGFVSDAKSENNPGYGTAEEALRVIAQGPRWIAAKINDKGVYYRQRQNISFQVIEG